MDELHRRRDVERLADGLMLMRDVSGGNDVLVFVRLNPIGHFIGRPGGFAAGRRVGVCRAEKLLRVPTGS